MICLAIETTGKYLGLGLYSFEKTGAPRKLAGHFREAMSRQAELLIPTLDGMMRRRRITRERLSLLAVDVGPGSFTGVRVGLAAARMMAQALELPLVGVSSLEAMAWPFAAAGSAPLLVPVLPAVPGEIYFAAYAGLKTTLAPAWKTDADLAAFLSTHQSARLVTEPPHPDALAEIAIGRFRKNARSKFFFDKAVPTYLLPSWAERSRRSA